MIYKLIQKFNPGVNTVVSDSTTLNSSVKFCKLTNAQPTARGKLDGNASQTRVESPQGVHNGPVTIIRFLSPPPKYCSSRCNFVDFEDRYIFKKWN